MVIVGGSAGCMAANLVLEMVIFEKGGIKYSGSIARGMDALNIVIIHNLTIPEFYIEASTLNCYGIPEIKERRRLSLEEYQPVIEQESHYERYSIQ